MSHGGPVSVERAGDQNIRGQSVLASIDWITALSDLILLFSMTGNLSITEKIMACFAHETSNLWALSCVL